MFFVLELLSGFWFSSLIGIQNNEKVNVTEMHGKKLLFHISGKATYLFAYQVWHEIINKLYRGLPSIGY